MIDVSKGTVKRKSRVHQPHLLGCSTQLRKAMAAENDAVKREADILALRGKKHAPPCAPTKRVNLYRTQGATT